MKRLVRISKLLILGACFLNTYQSQAMVNGILDYIQQHKAPIAVSGVAVAIVALPFYKLRWVPYDLAVRFGYPNIAKSYLIATRNSTDALDYGLRIATSNGQAEVVKMLIQAGADVNRHHRFDNPMLINALRNAGHNDSPEAVRSIKLLLDAGANPFAVDMGGNSALTYAEISPRDSEAIKRNKLEIQRLLRFYRARLNLEPQIEYLLERVRPAQLARETIEEQLKASGSQAGMRDISGIIKGYL